MKRTRSNDSVGIDDSTGSGGGATGGAHEAGAVPRVPTAADAAEAAARVAGAAFVGSLGSTGSFRIGARVAGEAAALVIATATEEQERYYENYIKNFVNACERGNIDAVKYFYRKSSYGNIDELKQGLAAALKNDNVEIVRFIFAQKPSFHKEKLNEEQNAIDIIFKNLSLKCFCHLFEEKYTSSAFKSDFKKYENTHFYKNVNSLFKVLSTHAASVITIYQQQTGNHQQDDRLYYHLTTLLTTTYMQNSADPDRLDLINWQKAHAFLANKMYPPFNRQNSWAQNIKNAFARILTYPDFTV